MFQGTGTVKPKIIILIVGIIVLVQVLSFAIAQQKAVEDVQRATRTLADSMQRLAAEKKDLENRLNRLQSSIADIPSSLLTGFEDPETGFVSFMDYVNTPLLRGMGGDIAVRQTQVFKEAPVPLHESRFEFRFRFLDTVEAEAFFDYLLLQSTYPLQVSDLTLKRIPGEKPSGVLTVSLLIPAKLRLPAVLQSERSSP